MRLSEFKTTAIAAVALICAAGAANATTVSTVIDFDGLNGNLTNEIIGDYQFTTLNIQNSTQCATGSCIQEANGQGNITTMTRVDGGAFDLDSFYFSLQGNGRDASNSVSISANTGTTFTYALGEDDSNGALEGDIFLYDNATNSVGADLFGSGEIDNSQGANGPNYIVFYGVEFDNVLSVSWSGATTANTRIDNIGVTANMVPPNVVPLPATGLLLMMGVAGLGAISRKRR